MGVLPTHPKRGMGKKTYYEEDGYIEDDYFIPNGKSSFRFRIQGKSPDSIDEMLNTIVKFCKLQ